MPSGLWLYAYIALWALLILETGLMVGIIRQIGTLNAHYVKNDPDAGLPLGALAPALGGEDVFGRPLALGSLQGKRTLVYFLSTKCPSCKGVLARAHTLAEMQGVDLVLVFGASKTKVQLHLAEMWRGMPTPGFFVAADPHFDVADRYQAVSVPYAVLVDEDGRVGGKGMMMTFSEVALMIRQSDELRERRHERGRGAELIPAGAVSHSHSHSH